MNIQMLLTCLLLISLSDSWNIDRTVIKDGLYQLHVNLETMQMQLVSKGQVIVPEDQVSGFFLNEEPVSKTEVIHQSEKHLSLLANTINDQKAKVDLRFINGVVSISVFPDNELSQVSLRFGGMPVAHGLGDVGAWSNSFNLVEKEEKIMQIENDGGKKRWLSTFTIFPKNNFAAVFFDRGKKSVVLSENTFQMNLESTGNSNFYLMVGKTREIYSNYKRIRNENGYQDVKPKSRLFELGWESWDALGWNTNQETVKETLSKFHDEGYPIRWAVTGSGFWDEGGTTTSFGRFGEKFPEPDSLRAWMHQKDIFWMIGLRTNLVPSGGPYFPVTDRRDKNLKVQSFYGNKLSDEAIEKDILLTDSDGNPIQMTSGIFPIVPCYIIDGNKPGAADWFRQNYAKWGVDGIKEDTMMELNHETSIFNNPIEKIASAGSLVMARCGEYSSPGTLQRINDTGVGELSKRIPINYFQYAASGAPNVYSDVAGVHNMHNTKAIGANIRHTWLLSLTAGLAVGAFPSKWPDQERAIFKKAIDFHFSLVPYLFSAAMDSHITGFPYSLTPMSIAYSGDPDAVGFENFQWMIGESLLATPLLKGYKNGKKDIFLPQGVWFDWETSEKFIGPVIIKDFDIPLSKTPCFVGGKGVVILRDIKTSVLRARVYSMPNERSSTFYSLDRGDPYQIDVSAIDLYHAEVIKVSTQQKIHAEMGKGYLEFAIEEGEDYLVQLKE